MVPSVRRLALNKLSSASTSVRKARASFKLQASPSSHGCTLRSVSAAAMAMQPIATTYGGCTKLTSVLYESFSTALRAARWTVSPPEQGCMSLHLVHSTLTDLRHQTQQMVHFQTCSEHRLRCRVALPQEQDIKLCLES